jgi:hypothetical protein
MRCIWILQGAAELRSLIEIKTFRVACGEFVSTAGLEAHELEIAGFAHVPDGIRFQKDMFAARARGTSMQPRIDDGDWLCFSCPILAAQGPIA